MQLLLWCGRFLYVRAVLFTTVMLALSCCRPSPDDLGKFSIEVHVFHHVLPIEGCHVYLKEYTTEFPGKDTLSYHFSAVSDTNGVARFGGLLPGKHYLYGIGYDGRDSVTGNRAIMLNTHDPDGHAKFFLYVSEKH